MRCGLAVHELLLCRFLLTPLPGFAEGENRADEEDAGDHPVKRTMGNEPEQDDADGRSDDDMNKECGSRTEPHTARLSMSREHEGREHGLVGKLAQKNYREDGDHGSEVHL